MAQRAREPTGEPGGGGAADPAHGLSSLAAGYRKAEPYMAASSTLLASVAVFTLLGYGLDRWLGHSVQWMLVVGAVVGIAVGFTAFFTKIAAATRADHRT
ncbi:AtpZ/AtpI family protein [Anaeromyxobacter terrae]|uniref:AtpZ/AtpI family protein n=1 Tax=Anaeromyxobacter terrae TaxID=2925406 RepID=UPI001F57884C|nr:AtpZ/AtpI family protein [Anaeromyxobacter sp. SG22]